MADQKEISLYKIVSPSGRVYVGQTVNPRNRFLYYRRTLAKSQAKLNASFNKYGFQNHKFKVISTVPFDQADYSEKYLISYYNSVDRGLNILEGGAIKWTQEMRTKQAKSLMGRKLTDDHKLKISLAGIGNKYSLGSKRSLEFRNRVSKALTGLKRKDTSKYKGRKFSLMKPIDCFSLDGILLKQYDCILDTKNDGYSYTYLNKLINNGIELYKGKIWKLRKP